MTKEGRATLRGEHLVPCLEMPRQNVFVGVKTGKKYDKGYVVYVGREVNPDDILKKLNLSVEAIPEARSILESFVQELQAYKIGNVISVSFPDNSKCALKKELERPTFEEPKRKLP